jgi:hypothetical protein
MEVEILALNSAHDGFEWSASRIIPGLDAANPLNIHLKYT